MLGTAAATWGRVEHTSRLDQRLTATPFSALTSRTFLGALLVLVLNDHLLKYAGLLPGWLTGKVSDFAGVIVATLLVCAVLRVRTRGQRAAAFTLALTPFVAINLSTGAAHAAESLMAFAGWRVWSDPTDLVALAMVPLAWRVGVASDGAVERTALVRVCERTALVLAALACVATSAPTQFLGSAVAVNMTGERLTLRVRYLQPSRVDCPSIRGRIDQALSRDLFGEGRTYELEPGQVLPLDRPGSALFAGASGICEAVLLDADGLDSRVVVWTSGVIDRPEFVARGDTPEPESVEIGRGPDGRLLATAHSVSALEMAHLLDRVDAPCLDDDEGIQWSGPSWVADDPTIERVERAADGCLRVDLAYLYGPNTLHLCGVPAWAFPFEAGDVVGLVSSPNVLTVENAQWHLDVRRVGDEFGPAPPRFASSGEEVTESDCNAQRLACGAFVEPLYARVGEEWLAPGQSAVVPEPRMGAQQTVMLGRYERVLVTTDDCDPVRRTLGVRGEYLVLTEMNLDDGVME